MSNQAKTPIKAGAIIGVKFGKNIPLFLSSVAQSTFSLVVLYKLVSIPDATPLKEVAGHNPYQDALSSG